MCFLGVTISRFIQKLMYYTNVISTVIIDVHLLSVFSRKIIIVSLLNKEYCAMKDSKGYEIQLKISFSSFSL